ncbi:MAG: hypothetical protein J4473_01875 [Candidatus Aenigmarchaeota archaeon]|nr:hypothetical protein [Candidatus Aenigmarchaeota archaeon]
MNKKYLILLVVIFFVITLIFIALLSNNQNKDCDPISDQNTRNDCYHTFAHETGNKTVCSKISDSEKKEHCSVHIPE